MSTGAWPIAESRPAASVRLSEAIGTPAGAEAIRLLESIDPADLDDHDRIRLLSAWTAQDGWLMTRRTAALVAVAGPRPRPSAATTGSPDVVDEESVVAEVACALRVSTVTAASGVAMARALHGPLSGALPAVESGAWGFGHVRVVEAELMPLLPGAPAGEGAARQALVSAVLRDVLAHAATDTPARLRRRIRTSIARRDAGALTARAADAASRRGISLEPLPDLQGRLSVDAPWAQVAWIHRVVDSWARRERERRHGRGRPADAGQVPTLTEDASLAGLRVDGLTEAARLLAVAMGMAHSGAAAAPDGPAQAEAVIAVADELERRGAVVPAPDGPVGRRRSWSQAVVIVPAATALRAAEEPGWIPGYGPVPGDVARALAADAEEWRRFLVDEHGRLLDAGRTRYRPRHDLGRPSPSATSPAPSRAAPDRRGTPIWTTPRTTTGSTRRRRTRSRCADGTIGSRRTGVGRSPGLRCEAGWSGGCTWRSTPGRTRAVPGSPAGGPARPGTCIPARATRRGRAPAPGHRGPGRRGGTGWRDLSERPARRRAARRQPVRA